MSATLPHSLEAERAVLGGILLKATALHELSDIAIDDFFLPAHREILEAMRSVSLAGTTPDVLTVTDEMHRKGHLARMHDGEAYLLTLPDAIQSVEALPHYAKIVREKSALRRVVALATELRGRAIAEEDAATLAANAVRDLTSVVTGSSVAGPMRLGERLSGVLDEIGSRAHEPAKHAVMSGIGAFDSIIRGFGPGKLVVVAARPGVGKTAFARGILANAARTGIPGLVFSLEMGFQEMAERFLSGESLISGHEIGGGRINAGQFRELYKAAERLSQRPIWVDDRVLRVEQISAAARAWFARLPQGTKQAIVAVDYLGLIRSSGGESSREREVAQMAWSMKVLAKDLSIPVILVSQLNRRVEQEGRRPQLSDLRESGAIEQDADMVVFPYRNMEAPEDGGDGSGPAELIVAKHRGGPTGTVPCWWRAETMTYHDVDGRE